MSGRSIVEYLDEHEKYRCGYCGSSDTNYSHGMWAHSLTVEDYQDLIDRGWRRSGKYVYKPTMNMTCCPQHTIKCSSLNFKMSKSHKKVVKKFNQFINSNKKPSQSEPTTSSREESEIKETFESPVKSLKKDESDCVMESMEASSIETSNVEEPPKSTEAKASPSEPHHSSSLQPVKIKTQPKPGIGADPEKPSCQKAKERRREKWLQKQQMKGSVQKIEPKSSEKSLEEWLRDIKDVAANPFEIRLVRSHPRSDAFNSTYEESYSVYKKYEMKIHKKPDDKPSIKQYTRFLVDSPLEKNESYEVFKKYQMKIHKDDESECDLDSYLRFLVDSPLMPKHTDGGFTDGYGSFHQHYLINGRIVAVGVIDILPTCVSSVYLYYDPEFFFLSLGTYTALQELAFTRYLHSVEPSIVNYYMGFYIHSCPKMRYKGQYIPSFLLCPVTYTWQPIEKCREKLDADKFCRLDDSPTAKDEEGQVDLDTLLVLHKHQAMPYPIYRALSGVSSNEDVKQYAGMVGRRVASRMLLFRS